MGEFDLPGKDDMSDGDKRLFSVAFPTRAERWLLDLGLWLDDHGASPSVSNVPLVIYERLVQRRQDRGDYFRGAAPTKRGKHQ